MIYSDILNHVRTLADVEKLSYETNILIGGLFKKTSFEKSLKSVSLVTSQQIKEALLKNNIKITDKRTIKDFLVGLREKIGNLKPLKIYLAFTPTQTIIDTVFSWVLRSLGFGYVLDIEENKEILGGAIITFGGKYKDYSLKKSIEEAFANKREEMEIRKLLNLDERL